MVALDRLGQNNLWGWSAQNHSAKNKNGKNDNASPRNVRRHPIEGTSKSLDAICPSTMVLRPKDIISTLEQVPFALLTESSVLYAVPIPSDGRRP